jgi:hypothetical protein
MGSKSSLLINLETNLSLQNINKMIKSKFFNSLDGVVIGRSDLAGSLYLSKNDVNSKTIFHKKATPKLGFESFNQPKLLNIIILQLAALFL